MAKRAVSNRSKPKHFNFDLESLLMSDLSQEDPNDSLTYRDESCKHSKKFKAKKSKPQPANEVTLVNAEHEREEHDDIEDPNDVSKFFENVGNDFTKSMQSRKTKLGQFTEAVISIYQSKFTDLIKKQEAEIDELKEQRSNNIVEELNKFEDEFKKLKQQENKIIMMLEQQLKIIQKTYVAQIERIENFRTLHKNFVQVFDEIKIKHKNEIMELKKSIAADMCDLQHKFLMDSKKEEMQTMKKYLSSVYF